MEVLLVGLCVSNRQREVCVCVCVCVHVCLFICVFERKRERERDNNYTSKTHGNFFLISYDPYHHFYSITIIFVTCILISFTSVIIAVNSISRLLLLSDEDYQCQCDLCRELSSTFARLCHQADCSKQQLEEELRQLDSELRHLQEVASSAKTLR